MKQTVKTFTIGRTANVMVERIDWPPVAPALINTASRDLSIIKPLRNHSLLTEAAVLSSNSMAFPQFTQRRSFIEIADKFYLNRTTAKGEKGKQIRQNKAIE